nr:MAG TPA: hypothetical protein [Caudoviricetes sp.]
MQSREVSRPFVLLAAFSVHKTILEHAFGFVNIFGKISIL